MLSFVSMVSFVFLALAIASFSVLGSTQEADRIANLPAQPMNVNFVQYSGFVILNKVSGKKLFYWLVEAPVASESKPLLLWLNGGPGCSSVGFGAFEEIGPFRVLPDGKTLAPRPFAWNSEANLLFLESPVGVGFSHSKSHEKLGDKNTAEDAYAFLVKWFKRFPQYKYRDFYMAGESYAGHYIPQLAQVIMTKNRGIIEPVINLKGFLLGNPTIDFSSEVVGQFEYWWSHGFISDTTYDDLKRFCSFNSWKSNSTECYTAYSRFPIEAGYINIYNILTRPCGDGQNYFSNFRFTHWMYGGAEFCLENYTTKYLNRADVQKAFHLNISHIPYMWKECSDAVAESWGDRPDSVLPILRDLIAGGLRIWLFSGDADALVPLTSTRNSIRALKLKTLQNWYPWYYHNGEVGGWSQIYDGLTFVTIRKAGHQVPLYRPAQAHILFRHFLSNKRMPYENF